MNEPTPFRQPVNSPPARLYRLVDRAFAALRRPQAIVEIDHPVILARVKAEAGWSHRYAFMVLMSAGIAILGLLLSSPAVIIGAMLVSPLMGPIIGLGFAIAVFDWVEVRRAFLALAAGAALAVGFAAAIVLVSPLTERTPEILARTRPNLFDLLVAVFSALAGGYATIRGRGETIVGVAIATALMPPLAVVGFGLATGDTPIFAGALALFVTNLVAIALSATVMAKFYGFGSHLSPDQSRAQGWALLAIFLLLALPLGYSLRQIAWETLAIRTVRDTILDEFGSEARIDILDPRFEGGGMSVRAIILTPAFRAEAPGKIEEILTQRLERSIDLSLSQIVTDRDPDTLLRARAETGRPARSFADTTIRDAAALATGADPADILVDPVARRGVVRMPAREMEDLAAVRAIEARLAQRYPDWRVEIVPSPAGLPLVPFAAGSAELSEPAAERVDAIAWALTRWGDAQATVLGRAAGGEAAGLALARAEAVAERLSQSGIEATAAATPRTPDTVRLERELGAIAFRAALVGRAPRREPPG
ncbi:DUF389 domain-containing protein [Thermaurantiacus sp.]